MADKRAVANGNRSAGATRNGGTLPVAGDTVYADGKTVTVDQNITVESIRTTQRTGGTAGGSFIGANVTITGNIIAGTTRCFGTNVDGAYVTVYGDVYGGSGSGAYGLFTLTGTGHVHTVYGNVYGGSQATAYGVYMSSGMIYLTGNTTGGVANGIYLANGTNATIVGNVGSGGLYCFYNNTVYITGNVTGGADAAIIHANGYQILLHITGIVSAGSVGAGIDMLGSTTDGLIQIIGEVRASATQNGIIVRNRKVEVTGTVVNNGGMNAINSKFLKITPSASTVWTLQDTSNVDFNLFTAEAFDPPSEADVREFTTYGSGVYEGTLIVPDPDDVRHGVYTDNTVGTADFELTEVMTALRVVNEGVQKASKFIPHTTNL